MCGRYRLSRRKHIEQHFDAISWEEDWSPRYNIAPTQPVPVIRQHPKEPIRQLFADEVGSHSELRQSPLYRFENHQRQSETAATKPAFRDPMRFRRCLIPADGFYVRRGLT
jgi:putative SOS response-associated peptidase YedK